MICLSTSTIMILMEDGSKKRFDAEELQQRLTESCCAVGMKDYWLAEDMTNAVENALQYQAEHGVTFTENEINLFVEKMLEQAGYQNVANKFKLSYRSDKSEKSFSIETLCRFIQTNLRIDDKEAMFIAKKVTRACSSLAMNNPPVNFILELAKYYKSIASVDQNITSLKNTNMELPMLILQRKEIIPLLSDKTNEAIEHGIIDISGVSTLFPAIKIDVKLEALSKFCGLNGLLTELVFFPCFNIAIDSINNIVHVVRGKIFQQKEILKNIPVFLRFSDIYPFCEKYFGVEFPERSMFCKELVAVFTEMLKVPVQVKGLKTT